MIYYFGLVRRTTNDLCWTYQIDMGLHHSFSEMNNCDFNINLYAQSILKLKEIFDLPSGQRYMQIYFASTKYIKYTPNWAIQIVFPDRMFVYARKKNRICC